MTAASGHDRRLHARLKTAIVLMAIAVESFAEPAQIPPWEEGYARSEGLQRRMSYVLENLLQTSRSDPDVHAALSKVALRTPLNSADPTSPNAYASPGKTRALVIMEARFLDQIGGASSAGAFLAWYFKEESLQRICEQLAADDRAAKSRGTIPVFHVELEGFHETSNPVVLRALQRLQGILADEAMIWFLLHEAGHIVLEHSATDVPVLSRAQEASADRWASQTMLDLGFGLFGTSSFLDGYGAIELCLEELGYKVDEEQSTHPLWATRAISMRARFDVIHSGRGSPRRLVILTPAGDAWYHIAEPGHDFESLSSGIGHPFRVAPEWDGRSLTVYGRVEGGNRFVLRIPDAYLGLPDGERTVFDGAGKQVSLERFTALQVNPTSFDWLELKPGVRLGDLSRRPIEQPLRDALIAAAVPPSAHEGILDSFRNFRKRTNDALTSYMKAAIGEDQVKLLIGQAASEYHELLRATMNEQQIAAFNAGLGSDPMSGWSLGHGAEHYEKLEKELLDRNLRDQE